MREYRYSMFSHLPLCSMLTFSCRKTRTKQNSQRWPLKSNNSLALQIPLYISFKSILKHNKSWPFAAFLVLNRCFCMRWYFVSNSAWNFSANILLVIHENTVSVSNPLVCFHVFVCCSPYDCNSPRRVTVPAVVTSEYNFVSQYSIFRHYDGIILWSFLKYLPL